MADDGIDRKDVAAGVFVVGAALAVAGLVVLLSTVVYANLDGAVDFLGTLAGITISMLYDWPVGTGIMLLIIGIVVATIAIIGAGPR